jgi:hypothetical protein
VNYNSIQDEIVAAYDDLSRKPQDWVRLAKLRPMLSSDPAAQNEMLLAMVQTGYVHLAPDSNRKVLTQDDHDAALWVGGEANHLLAIEDGFFQEDDAAAGRQFTDVETGIHLAYLNLAVKGQDWVSLVKIRDHDEVARFHVDDVDAALLNLFRHGDAHLVPESNRKALTDTDHAAALWVGSEYKHLIAFGN